MKTGKFYYEVRLAIDFTDDELQLLRTCMLCHYDGRTKAAAKQGGFLYGWLNYKSMAREGGDENATVICSQDQLDTCMKALEQMTPGEPDYHKTNARIALTWRIRKAFILLNEEYEKMNSN